MGKALRIRNVDFSENKLDTVSFVDPVPCTGINLSPATIAITKIGNTAEISVSVTPLDCTDPIQWSVSPANVITVQNGVVTAVGIGSATITVQCGTKYATCAVVVTHVMADSDMWHENGYGAIGADLTANPPKNFVYEQSNTRYRLYADTSVYTDNPDGKYRAFADKANNPGYYQNGIEIPAGATQMNMTIPSGLSSISIAWQNNALVSGYYTDRPAFAAVTRWDNPISASDITEYVVDLTELPSGTNSFVINLTTPSGASAATVGDVTITFG